MAIKLTSHPKVGLDVHFKGDTIQRISLSLSTAFTLKTPAPPSLLRWLKEYAQGNWTPFPLPPYKTTFSQKAALYLQSTSPGELLTYQELSAAIGHPGAARAIGNFCSGNLFPLLIPCHRVIPSSRHLGSYTPDPRIKEELLQFEQLMISRPSGTLLAHI